MTTKRTSDILRDKQFRKWAKHVREDMVPKMAGSAYVMTIASPNGSDADVKQAVEIGFAILMDKPLIVLKPAGRVVAEKLLRIADHIVEGDMDTAAGRQAIGEKLKAVMKQ